MPFDETAHLLDMLLFTAKVIAESSPGDKQRISNAYRDARSLVVKIDHDAEGSARPRIMACFEKFDVYKAANDAAAAGWMLAALQERVAERNLSGWSQLRKIIRIAASELPPPGKAALN